MLMNKKEIPVYDIDHLSLFKNKDIIISRLAPYLAVHKNLYLAHKHSFYHLILFTEGGGSHDIDFDTFSVQPYHIYFMIPGQVHSWNFVGQVNGYVVNFSEQFFKTFLVDAEYLDHFKFFSGIVKESVFNLPEDLQLTITNYFEDLLSESESKLPFSIDMVRSILLQLLLTVGRIGFTDHINKPSSYNQILFRRFQKLIEKNFITIHLPKSYAEILNVTPNYLNSLCRDLVGLPAGAVIRNRIILEAKRLLVNLELNISEIAYKLDFQDNSYFSKFFKNQVGMTPEDFRKGELNKVANANILK